MPHRENLLGYSFIIRKSGEGRRPSLSFLSKHQRFYHQLLLQVEQGSFLSLHRQARFTNYCFFYVYRQYVRGIINLLSSLCSMWVSMFHCFGGCLVLLLCGFVAKEACLLLWLSKPAFRLPW